MYVPSRAKIGDSSSERFLDTEIEAARAVLAPSPIGREIGPRPLVEQHPEAESAGWRVAVEQRGAGLRAADRRRVEERDEAEDAVWRQAAAILHLAVEQALAAVPPFAVPAAGAHVAAGGRQIEVGRDAARHHVAHQPHRDPLRAVLGEAPV